MWPIMVYWVRYLCKCVTVCQSEVEKASRSYLNTDSYSVTPYTLHLQGGSTFFGRKKKCFELAERGKQENKERQR